MKKLIVLVVASSFLFQSCYSYKSIEIKNTQLLSDNVYKVKYQDKFYNGNLISQNDSIIKMIINKEEVTIRKIDIEVIRKRNFSVFKTLGLPLIIVATIVGLFALNYNGPQLGNSLNYPN